MSTSQPHELDQRSEYLLHQVPASTETVEKFSKQIRCDMKRRVKAGFPPMSELAARAMLAQSKRRRA